MSSYVEREAGDDDRMRRGVPVKHPKDVKPTHETTVRAPLL
jgi:hypothetical protein